MTPTELEELHFKIMQKFEFESSQSFGVCFDVQEPYRSLGYFKLRKIDHYLLWAFHKGAKIEDTWPMSFVISDKADKDLHRPERILE